MKIAVPVDEKKLVLSDLKVSMSFGRSPFIMIYDTESNTFDFVTNPGSLAQGGAGIKAAQKIVDEQVDALLLPRCGQNAADVLTGSEVKMFKSTDVSVKQLIHLLEKRQLESMTTFHEGFHGGQ